MRFPSRFPALATVAAIVLGVSLSEPAFSQAYPPRPIEQIAMLPLNDGVPSDIDKVVAGVWGPYYNTSDENAFTRDNLRAGRADLNDDGWAELVLMLDHVLWKDAPGKPYLIATWQQDSWRVVGWGWGDEDGLFVTEEVMGGWHSIDSGSQWVHWTGKAYLSDDKPTADSPSQE